MSIRYKLDYFSKAASLEAAFLLIPPFIFIIFFDSFRNLLYFFSIPFEK